MVDLNALYDTLKDVGEKIKDTNEGFSGFFDNLGGAIEKITGLSNTLSGSNDSLNNTNKSAKQATESLDQTYKVSNDLLNSFIDFGIEAKNTFLAIGSGSRESIDAMGHLNEGIVDVIASVNLMALGAPTAFNSFNQSAKDVNSDISGNLLPNFNKLADFIAKTTNFPLIGLFKSFVGVAIPAVDSVNNLENSLLALNAQSGDLGRVFDQTGTSEKNLNKLTDEFVNHIRSVGQNTGESVPHIMEFSNAVLKIPGLYDQIISTDLAGNLDFTESAMKVARGTTQSLADVQGVLNDQFDNFGKKGQLPLELMSRMYGVGQSLKIPFDHISGLVKNVSEQFKFLGDNTQGALNIIEGLSPKLLASGLGPKAVQELIGNVTTQLSSLDIAQKSLLSSRTGGAGGLQGGFQIDQLLSEGKIDEVYKKMETALKQQFGGKITTLKEGSSSQAGAAQLQKEISYLTQGPFGALVKDAGQAEQLLKAWGSGAAPTKEKTEAQLKSGLSQTIDKGRNVEQAQFTVGQQLANNIALEQIESQKQLGQSMRDLTQAYLTPLTKGNTENLTERVSHAPTADKALLYSKADIISGVKNIYGEIHGKLLSSAAELKASKKIKQNEKEEINNKVENNVGPTVVEANAARPNNNLAPVLPVTPEVDATQRRHDVLKQTQESKRDTVLASTNQGKDHTITIKVQSTGLDGKTKEEVLAIARAQGIKDIQINKANDNSSATVGYDN